MTTFLLIIAFLAAAILPLFLLLLVQNSLDYCYLVSAKCYSIRNILSRTTRLLNLFRVDSSIPSKKW